MTTRQYRDRTKHQNGASITNSSVSLTAGTLLQGQGLSGATFPYTVAVYAQDLSGNVTSYEEMDVTGGTYPTLTVSRGINGTTAVAHDTTHIIAQVVGKNDCDNWLQAGNSIDIGSDSANIPKVNLTDQGSKPAAPAAGHHLIYAKSGGIYMEDSAATETQLNGGGGVAPGTELGYAQITASINTASTTAVDAAGLSVTVTVPSSGVMVEFFCWSLDSLTTNGARVFVAIVETTGPTTIAEGSAVNYAADGSSGIAKARHIPGAGSRTYKIQWFVEGGGVGTGRMLATSTAPAYIRVTAI